VNQRKARRLAWSLVGLTLAFAAAFITLAILDSSRIGLGNPVLAALGLGFLLVHPALGVLIDLRRPENPIDGMGGRLVIWSEANRGTTIEGTSRIGAMEAVS
jgi:hypothetical protein